MGLASAVLINEITRSNKIKADAAIGVVTTAGFAIGVFLIILLEVILETLRHSCLGISWA